ILFQAEDGIRDRTVTGVQTCALPICQDVANSIIRKAVLMAHRRSVELISAKLSDADFQALEADHSEWRLPPAVLAVGQIVAKYQIGRASCRERVEVSVGAGAMAKADS